MPQPPLSTRTRRGAAAGLLGAAAALAAATGTGPVPSIFQLTGASEDVSGRCDEAEHAADPACAGTLRATDHASSTDDSTTTTTSGLVAGAPSEVRTVQAGDAGSIMVAVEGANLRLLTAVPNTGWQVEVEHASGREVEVTFRSGTMRVDVQVELEDGQVRERVRTRDDATDTDIRVENGVVVRDDDADDLDDDRSGSNSGSDSDDDADDPDDDADDADDDSSGPGSGSDDGSHDTDDDSSGSGSDDGPDHD